MRAVIAGTGRLPELLADALSNSPHRLCALHGFVPKGWEDRRVDVFRLEQIGSLLDRLVADEVREVCFAGVIRRPTLDPSAVDAASAPLMASLQDAARQGDDAALRAIAALFEARGMGVISAQSILPDLLPAAGVLTAAQPGPQDRIDAVRAEEIANALGAADVGQACVVALGQAVGIEGAGGTDWLLRSLTPERRAEAPWLPKGGLLFKAPKPGQDRRFDMPTIGAQTISGAAQAGLHGIVLEAGGVQVLEANRVTELADQAGLFVWLRPKGGS